MTFVTLSPSYQAKQGTVLILCPQPHGPCDVHQSGRRTTLCLIYDNTLHLSVILLVLVSLSRGRRRLAKAVKEDPGAIGNNDY